MSVRTRTGTTTVLYSASTTFKVITGADGTPTSSSSSSLKVGDLIGVQGTRNSGGGVTATSIVIGTAAPGGQSGPAGPGGPGNRTARGWPPSAASG